MPRIPKTFIDDLLTRIDVVDVVDARLPLKKQGANYGACCPFHSEKTPSFTVSQDKQFYHCFGCGAHGSAIGFIMEYDNVSFPDAIETLAQDAGIEVPYEDTAYQEQQQNLQPLLEANQQACHLYQQQLKQSELAIDYLKQRALTGEIVRDYAIGYAPAQWQFLENTVQASVATLDKAGLITRKNNKTYGRFRNRIMFPIRNRRGQVIGFGGRVIDPEDQPKYLNSPETPVFNKSREVYGLYETQQFHRRQQQSVKDLIVVEGYMDAVALAQHGLPKAVATLGTAVTVEQVALLLKVCRQLTFCFDGDTAGRKAAWRALENVFAQYRDGLTIRFLLLPDGEDPDSLINQEGLDAFQQRLNSSLSIDQFFFAELKQQVDLSSLDGKAQLSQLAQPLVNKLPASVFKTLLTNQLAELINIDVQALRHTEIESPARRPRPTARPVNPRAPTGVKMNAVRTLIAVMLQQPLMSRLVEERSNLRDWNYPGIPLLFNLTDLCLENPELTTGQILEHYRDTPHEQALAKLAVYDFPAMDLGDFALECNDALEQLQRRYKEDRHQALIEKIRQQGMEALSDDETHWLKTYKHSD